MEKTVTLTFKNNLNNDYKVQFKTLENIPSDVLDLWSRKLTEFLSEDKGEIQLRWSAFRFPDRDPAFLTSELEKVISIINSSFLNTEYGYEIEITEIPEEYPMEVHNIVHHHFEKLIGQHWNHSEWWNLVMERKDWKLAEAICALNELSHELEEYVTENLPPHLHTLLHFPSPHFSTKEEIGVPSLDLLNEELPSSVDEMFVLGSIPGAVYLQYTQTGKTLVEVLGDDDEHIDEENITSHRLCNGSVSICFGGHDNTAERQFNLQEYYKTLAAHKNIDITKPGMQLGRPQIGYIVTDDIDTVVEKLKEYRNLYSIEMDGIEKVVNTYTDRRYE